MKGINYFEIISAGAISPHMPDCKAIIVNIGNQKHITEALGCLYSGSSVKIYIVNTTIAKLDKVLERCREVGVPAIVNCAENLPSMAAILPERPYNAALVSGESYTEEEGNILHTLLKQSCLINFSNLGYQGYRYAPQVLQKLRERYFEEMRLGEIRDNISLCEPLVRDSEFVFFDLRSIRYSDYPYSPNANPNGLYAEEACQIARYIGLGQKLSSVFLFGGQKSATHLAVCNKLIAEIIWHICEGISVNLIENPLEKGTEECFLRKIVSLGDNGQEIIFITSSNTDRWWMEISTHKGKYVKMVPCSVLDYQTACKGEVPLRWLFFYTKYALL